jgi:methionine aminopeptidase
MKPIIIKSAQQIQNIKTAGAFLEELLILSAGHAQPGVSLLELEEHAEQFLRKHNLQ